MATKTAKKTTKAAPKATKTVTTSAGKTKTMPAKKPATKPSAAPKKKYSKGCIIAFIIGVLAVAALVGIVIYALAENVKKNDPAMVVEAGDGEKIATQYQTFVDEGFKMKIPNDFKMLDAEEVRDQYQVEEAEAAFVSKDDKASFIVATDASAKIKNDQIEAYLGTMKTIFTKTGTVLKTDYYQNGDHNIGLIQVVLTSAGTKYYEELAFFSLDGQLVLLTFSAEDAVRSKWQPVSDYMIKSLEILK